MKLSYRLYQTVYFAGTHMLRDKYRISFLALLWQESTPESNPEQQAYHREYAMNYFNDAVANGFIDC